MKKGIEMLGGSYVVDEFHMKKYVKKDDPDNRGGRTGGRSDEVSGERREKEAEGVGRGKGERTGRKEKEATGGKSWLPRKELEGDPNADKERRRSDGEQYGESYQSCAVSKDEFASDGLEQRGSGKAVRVENLLEEWKKGRRTAGGEKEEERKEEERVYSTQDVIKWEKRSRKRNGKYVEALQATISRQTGMRMYFQAAITGICG